MKHARLTLVSAEDYLALERSGEGRHEFVAGQVFAMVGAREDHNTIALNTAFLLRELWRGKPCRVFASDVKLQVEPADAYYYPDVFVTCDPRDTDPYIKRFPLLVVEVLSPHTEGIDRREKLRNYRLLETLKEYAIVAVDERKVEVYRLEPGAEWHCYTFDGADTVELASVGAAVPLNDIYEGVR